jgi:hypothetical protein
MATSSNLRLETLFRRILGAQVVLVLLLAALKWALYSAYSAHHCKGRALQAAWKDVRFCVTSGELQMWLAADYALIGLVGLFILTALSAAIYSQRTRR